MSLLLFSPSSCFPLLFFVHLRHLYLDLLFLHVSFISSILRIGIPFSCLFSFQVSLIPIYPSARCFLFLSYLSSMSLLSPSILLPGFTYSCLYFFQVSLALDCPHQGLPHLHLSFFQIFLIPIYLSFRSSLPLSILLPSHPHPHLSILQIFLTPVYPSSNYLITSLFFSQIFRISVYPSSKSLSPPSILLLGLPHSSLPFLQVSIIFLTDPSPRCLSSPNMVQIFSQVDDAIFF